MGVERDRIVTVPCHGLARAIENDPDGREARDLIDACAARASAAAASRGDLLYAGLCCTHYGYVAGEIREALARHCHQPAAILDPNERLVADLSATELTPSAGDGIRLKPGPTSGEEADRIEPLPGRTPRVDGDAPGPFDRRRRPLNSEGRALPKWPSQDTGATSVRVLSKVAMDERKRRAMARLVHAVSPRTAQALLSYAHVEDLF